MTKFKTDDKICGPTKEYKDGSCFDYESLVKIAETFNKKSLKKIKIPDNKKDLVKILDEKMKQKCDDQVCWLKQSFVKEIINDNLVNTFRPKGPEQKNAWLSTTNIDDVINQYHEKYPNFIYLGLICNYIVFLFFYV